MTPRPSAFLPRLSPARLEEYAKALDAYIETVRGYGERMAGGEGKDGEEGVAEWCERWARTYREQARQGERR